MTRRPRLPKKIGRYAILERISVGMIAEVYKARRGAEPVVCVKRIRPDVFDKDELVEAFQQEIKLARSFRHPNIVEVYDHGDDGGAYFVMELIDGCELETLIESTGQLTPPLVAHVGIEAASALAYIHHSGDRKPIAKPIAHCDVSPQNLLVRRDGIVKLSDFGVAKVLPKTGAEELTRKRGRERYWSPEQWLGAPLGSRTDLFSLGLVMWRALVGTHPYGEGRPVGSGIVNAWIQKHTIENDRRSVADAAPHAPAALQDAIERLLAPVEERIQTAEELLDVLSPLATLNGAAELAALVAETTTRGAR